MFPSWLGVSNQRVTAQLTTYFLGLFLTLCPFTLLNYNTQLLIPTWVLLDLCRLNCMNISSYTADIEWSGKTWKPQYTLKDNVYHLQGLLGPSHIILKMVNTTEKGRSVLALCKVPPYSASAGSYITWFPVLSFPLRADTGKLSSSAALTHRRAVAVCRGAEERVCCSRAWGACH